ncbi:hypothetical protein [Streptomyces badius]
MARDYVTEPSPSAEPKVSAASAASVSSRGPRLPDGVTTRTVYVALDGSEHGSVRGAVDKNEAIARAERANAMLAAGATVYDAARAWSWMDNPSIPDVLRKVTKDTPLIISHWQCRDTPGYTVCHFENDEYFVYVGGDAGSWSGPYGSKITLADIARYAEDTLRKHPELAVQVASAPTPSPDPASGEAASSGDAA